MAGESGSASASVANGKIYHSKRYMVGDSVLHRVALRPASMSRSGRFVAIRQLAGIRIVDTIGTAAPIPIDRDCILDYACVGDALWVVGDGHLERFALSTGERRGEPAPLRDTVGVLVPAPGVTARSALWCGSLVALVHEGERDLDIVSLRQEDLEGTLVVPLGARRIAIARRRQLVLGDAGRLGGVTVSLPDVGVPLAVTPIFAGRALVVLTSDGEQKSVVVCQPSGVIVRVMPLPRCDRWCIADQRGVAVVRSLDGDLIAFDLRVGLQISLAPCPPDIDIIDIDESGVHMLLCGRDTDPSPRIIYQMFTELFSRRSAHLRLVGGDAAGGDIAGNEPLEWDCESALAVAVSGPTPPPTEPSPPRPVEPAAAAVTIPDLPLRALRPMEPLPAVAAPPGAAPYASPVEHIHALCDVILARAVCAIASGWDSGLLSVPGDALPYRREVHAMSGKSVAVAADEVDLARARLRELVATAAARTQASLAAGLRMPFTEVARELGLTPTAAECLLVIAAPLLRGEIARLYGIVANDPSRPICDRYMVEQILAGRSLRLRDAIATELAEGAPLLRNGLVTAAAEPPDRYLFAALMVDPVLVARLRGQVEVGMALGAVAAAYPSGPGLDELCVPREILRDLVVALAHERVEGQAIRLLLHGRRGSGRRTVLAALAARAGRQLVVIHVERLAQSDGGRFTALLRLELQRAHLRGAIPCISGLGSLDTPEDAQLREQVRDVFRCHPGPVVFRCDVDVQPPIDPGYLAFTIPSVSETTRRVFWRQVLDQRGLCASGIDRLAQRFRIAPGAIVSATQAVELGEAPGPDQDLTDRLDLAARQHITARMRRVADRIDRLAQWEQVCLPREVIDSIRELIGRARHRQTVFEAWGFDPNTSRGLTALFYGAPGTGKTLVAGLIARELGLDLYRIDLARIVSKWIGETEKNLAEAFDAAEDGQCLILFDEADSLFAKRTEVKTSVDRYANLEVNYLLQRLDTFEGIAILTTNLEGAVDEAFKRRMSLRLSFPFPDEETRVRLWAAHIPPQAPIAGVLGLAELAQAYPLSGGYIRNCALRAAFLAAQEGRPLSHEHLLRAVHLEYLDMGKLMPGGRLH